MQGSERLSTMMDIESADRKFDLRLDDWLAADDFNFTNDFLGIENNINCGAGFPTMDFEIFVPRFAGAGTLPVNRRAMFLSEMRKIMDFLFDEESKEIMTPDEGIEEWKKLKSEARVRMITMQNLLYMVDTLESALWCLCHIGSYRECLLTAVNLGGDTDTIAVVAGRLAEII